MPSLLNSGLVDPAAGPISLTALATRLALSAPFSLRRTLEQIETAKFHSDITSSGLDAFSGHVDLTIRSDGTYQVHVDAHDAGLLSYKFRIVIVFAPSESVSAPNAIFLDVVGEVEGTDKTIPLVHEPERQFNWDYPSSQPIQLMSQQWYLYREGTMSVSKAYSYGGIIGTLEDAIKNYFVDLVTFIFGTAILHLPPIAAAIYLSSQFSDMTGIRFFGESGLVGLVAAAGAFYLVGPTMIFPIFLGAAGGAELLGPDHRGLHQNEIDFAKQVFDDTIPWDRVLLVDAVGWQGRPFTVPGMDQAFIINIGLGSYFADATKGTSPGNSIPGYIFIHELTHVWQIANGSWQGLMCDEAIINATTGSVLDAYKYGSPDTDWSDFNHEQQASVVADWFFGTWAFARNADPKAVRVPMNINDPYFKYIATHIRLELD